MNIKKTGLIAGLGLALFSSSIAQASASEKKEYNYQFKTAISPGYERASVKGIGSIQGPNLKIKSESDFPFGFMLSASYLKDHWNLNKKMGWQKDNQDEEKKSKAEYYSVMVGPTIKINEMASLYALAGISHSKFNEDANAARGKKKPNHLAYSAGIATTLFDHLELSAGYEGSKVNVAGKDKQLNAGVVNIGYAF